MNSILRFDFIEAVKSKNINQNNKNLTLEFNKARQAAITTEMLEIVSGAEALKG